MSAKSHDPGKDVDLATSVAGEEDPGASNEVGSAVESPKQTSSSENVRPKNPDDPVPTGRPNTGDT